MIHPVFCLFDSKALYYGNPWIQQNAEMAIRALIDIVNEPGNPVYNHPTDFSLIEIGRFDDEKGVIEPTDHINHGLAIQYQKKG